ncbi:MAG: proprotein convertase P-domain-containing protein [Lysobacterales bacterium]
MKTTGALLAAALCVWSSVAGAQALRELVIGSANVKEPASEIPASPGLPPLPNFSTDPLRPREMEPNGTFGTANPLTIAANGSAFIEGTIKPNGDQDFYSFTAQAGDLIYAAVTTASSANASSDSQLRILDTDGVTELEFDDDNGAFGSLSSSIAGLAIPASGTYFVRVNHFSATTQLLPYRLYLRTIGAPVPETEPNDTFPGQALPASGHVSGSTSATTDVDFYTLSLNAGDTVFASLDLDPERDNVEWNGQLGMGAFGPAPGTILTINDAGSTGPDSEAFIMTVPTGGSYSIRVNLPTGGTTFGTYRMSVVVFPRPVAPGVCTTHSSTDVPQTIPSGPGLVSSTITVPGNPRIADIDVNLQFEHTFVPDLDVHLRSPAGNDNGLFTDNGASVSALVAANITFDDEAAVPMGTYNFFNGVQFQPELAYRLSWFDGENAGGTWTLDIRDDASGDGGTLTGWSITICEPPPPPVCPAGTTAQVAYSTDFETDDAGFTSSGTANEWERGLPSFTVLTTCNSGSNCFVTDLDNTYDVSSDQELLSPAVDLTGLQPPVLIQWSQRYQMDAATADNYRVEAREAGGANPVAVFEWEDAAMTNSVGNPLTTINESAGWGQRLARVDSLAGTNMELAFRLTSNASTNLAGVGIDDVSVTACRPLAADLGITKTAPANAVPGATIAFQLVASNTGPDAAPMATVTDTFAATLSACTWTCTGAGGATCPANGSGNINATVNLPVAGTATFNATCTISPTATGTLSNTATISNGFPDPNAANDSATSMTNLTPQANLAITKSNGVTTVGAGAPTTYTIVASNAGPSAAPNSVITDTFPATLTGCSTTCVGAGGATCPAGPVMGNLNSVANLPVGGTATYSATCTVDVAAMGSISNTATVATGAGITDPTPGNNSATDTDTVAPPFDLSISKTNGTASSIAGTTTVYTIVASNAGPNTAAGATVTDSFPAACTTVNWTCVGAAGGTCAASGNGNINDVVTLPAGATATYSASCGIDPTATGTLSNTATVAAPMGLTDPTPANNTATDSDTLGASADVSIAKVAQGVPNPVLVGSSFSYLLTASNAGPSSASGVVVTDSLPATLTYVSNSCGASFTAPTLTWNVGTLAPAGSANCTINVTVAALGQIDNTASISSATTDPTPANNSSTSTLAGAQTADVSIGLSANAGPSLAVGDGFSYTVIGTNNGPGTASGLDFSLLLSSKLSFVSSNCGAVLNGNTLSWTVATLANGASTSCQIDVVVVLAGDAQASAAVTTNSFDPDLSNNTADLVVGTGAVPVPALGRLGLLLLMLISAGLGALIVGRIRSA